MAERIRRMEDEGIIAGYRAELNPEQIGLPLTAFIRIASGEGKCAPLAALVRQMPEVLECRRLTGSDSYILKVVLPSVQQLEVLLDRLMPYGQPTTSIVLSSPVTHRIVKRQAADHGNGANL